MGLTGGIPYRKLNRETGLFEWVYPEPIQYEKKEPIRRIDVRTKNKRRWKGK